MLKKILVTLIVAVTCCVVVPVVAQARRLNDGDVFDLSTASLDEEITIPANATVTLEGTAPEGAYVICGGGGTLTLQNATIKTVAVSFCPLYFNNTFNSSDLILVGDSTLVAGNNACGMGLNQVINFNISGDGSLTIIGDHHSTGLLDIMGFSNINVNSGTLYVSGDVDNGFKDIGNTQLSILNNASVILEHGIGGAALTTTHAFVEYENLSQVPSGYSVPDTWGYPIASYQKNEAPYFTTDSVNTSQQISIGDTPTRLMADDPNGKVHIASYALTSGSLPDGITLNNDGTFSGTAGGGDYTAHIEVRDANGMASTTVLNITVAMEVEPTAEPVANTVVTTQKVKNPETGETGHDISPIVVILMMLVIMVLKVALVKAR